jgi:Putative restriction endonuclease
MEQRVSVVTLGIDDLERARRGLRRAPGAGILASMPTLVMDPVPAEIEALIERRRRLGLDHRDEVWEGVYRMNPPPSHEHQVILQQLAEMLGPLARVAGLEPLIQEFGLGDGTDDFRVPDGGLHRPGATGVWHPTAALVIEIVSPGDESWKKLPFFAAHDVDEVLIIDPREHSVSWLGLENGEYQPIERSGLIDLGPSELAEQIDWPS